MKKPASKPNFDKLTLNSIEFLLQRERLEQLLYEVSEAVVGYNKDFKITLFNRVAEVMTGVTSDNALGKPLDTIVKISDEKKGPLNIKAFTAHNITNLRLHGVKDYAINLKSALLDSEDKPKECILTLTDITHEKDLEKLKEELFSVASHELKTPITIIKSYLWMLQNEKGGALNKKQQEYVTKAVNATERILALVNDILSISRLEQGRVEFNPKEIDLAKMLRDTVMDLEHKAQTKGLKISYDDDHSVLTAFADQEQTHEVVVNLVENAIKFTKDGEIRVTAHKSDDKVLVKVIDTGVGIDKNDLPKLFHKFGRLHYSYQSVAESKGTGLGLYIVKLYVEGMHGQVGVESQGTGKGSTFWFSLPLKPVN